MHDSKVVVLGGGLAGVATADALADAGARDVTIIEAGPALGGLAGSFEQDGSFYPLGYHHVLHRDRALIYYLDRIGALDDVRWRRIRMYFRVDGSLFDLGRPSHFLRFPMSLADKARFARLMLRCFGKPDWSEWEGRGADELIDTWAGPGVRRAIFDPLCRLKFERETEQVSAAWLGARLHYREGSAPLGYIPRANWTTVLCDGVTRLVESAGVTIRLGVRVTGLETDGPRIRSARLSDGTRVEGDVFVSALPTEIYTRLADDDTDTLRSIRYTGLLSTIVATEQRFEPDFYWMNLASGGHAACGIFLLSSLNPTIGRDGESCINFVTHLADRGDPRFSLPDDELLARYSEDCRAIFGFDLEPRWVRVNRVPMYSPIFDRGFRNPPIRSSTFENVWFAGNYRTFPSVASTGTALRSGVQAAEAILAEEATPCGVADGVRAFPLKSAVRTSIRRGP